MSNLPSILVSKGENVSRDYLASLPNPDKLGPRHRPVHHAELVETIDESLQANGWQVTGETFVLGRKGARLFGAFSLEPFNQEVGLLIGQTPTLAFIGDNTMQISLRLFGGQITMVCENMMVSGNYLSARRKHTTNLDLTGYVDGMVESLADAQRDLSSLISAARTAQLTDDQARVTICKAVEQDVIPARLLPQVCDYYFNESAPETQDRTRWSLFGSFTRALRDVPFGTRLPRSQRLNDYLLTTSSESK